MFTKDGASIEQTWLRALFLESNNPGTRILIT